MTIKNVIWTLHTVVLGIVLVGAGCGSESSSKQADEHGHEEHGDEHGKEEGHEKHGDEEAHEEHGDEHGAKGGHDEHGEDEQGHDEHEAGIVELTAEAAARVNIATTPVVSRAIAAEITTTGSVGYDEVLYAHVSPRIPGRVHKVSAQLGQRVKRGATVAVIDSIELGRGKAEFLQAKARHELARQTFEREKGLSERQISSEQDMLAAKAAYREASAILKTTKQTLRLFGLSKKQVASIRYEETSTALFSVRAPLNGKIVKKHATVGELVTPETTMFTIADLRTVWIWIDIYERDLSRVHLEDSAYIRVDSYPDRVFDGKISYISDEVDTDTRTVRARVDVENERELLRPGMFTQVRVSDPHAKDGTIHHDKLPVVPAKALQRDGDETLVFIKTGDNRYERREVRVGRRAGHLVEVLEGVKVGEDVVVTGTFLLKSEASKESMGGGHSH